jgi:hypothetical protein
MNITPRLATVYIAILVTAISMTAHTIYFPPGAFGENLKGSHEWEGLYSKYLAALKEPSLFNRTKSAPSQSYRFLWLRSFHKPVSVRLDVETDGTSAVTVKIGSGTNVSEVRGPVEERTRSLTKQETNSFLEQVSSLDFWKLPTQEEPVAGPDGARWILEGARGGQYHVVHRWTPKSGAVRTLGLILANDLGDLRVPSNEIY